MQMMKFLNLQTSEFVNNEDSFNYQARKLDFSKQIIKLLENIKEHIILQMVNEKD